MSSTRLALVPGEPAGVGPELCVALAQRPRDAALIAYADPGVLEAAARRAGTTLRLVDPDDADASRAGALGIVPIPVARPVEPGRLDVANAPSVIDALTAAARASLDGRLHGLVTGPVHKAIVNEAGIAYSGTTELLAHQAGCDVVMMLGHESLRVALATTHLSLRAVPDAITQEGLERTLRIVDTALRRDFGIAAPTVAVLGLNPHAGEDGHLGREETDVIAPVITRLRDAGLHLVGPLPADTAFLPQKLADFDAVVAMYHDQGLPVLKFSGFERAVNITLGLPYPRVAVDHGTALDLAGTGRADPASLFAAADLCAKLASHRRAS
ncbi:4-hydroxythreonine-4-phosphate dehydrogenase PdxA [Lysobacter sp. TY2-98]|uniref:4-hydroxythreonine-4-phosphate dehydrogenase PdxA n=1 Tax=Lysobacter sp. TY2-98 TaxID=2290922 RepID=UPI000E20C3D1|nr:4-hydroxythreonine-4-phosphate dehydrogenase PdxA [Lysobacter sp. TY2-98]AXK71113.1 4-hydroxythreonine-4-phosphate dehydrogenase PdxA [Lysobacter sp. TY2-98]